MKGKILVVVLLLALVASLSAGCAEIVTEEDFDDLEDRVFNLETDLDALQDQLGNVTERLEDVEAQLGAGG